MRDITIYMLTPSGMQTVTGPRCLHIHTCVCVCVCVCVFASLDYRSLVATMVTALSDIVSPRRMVWAEAWAEVESMKGKWLPLGSKTEEECCSWEGGWWSTPRTDRVIYSSKRQNDRIGFVVGIYQIRYTATNSFVPLSVACLLATTHSEKRISIRLTIDHALLVVGINRRFLLRTWSTELGWDE